LVENPAFRKPETSRRNRSTIGWYFIILWGMSWTNKRAEPNEGEQIEKRRRRLAAIVLNQQAIARFQKQQKQRGSEPAYAKAHPERKSA
jgi:hypothetical protein